jgi:hypothetical protein
MNQTGVYAAASALAAARKAEDVLVAMARPTLPVAPIELHSPVARRIPRLDPVRSGPHE